MSEERLNLGLRAVGAPGKQPGSGCGCGRHQQAGANADGGCGCGGHGRRAAAQVQANQAAQNTNGGCGCGGHERRHAQTVQPDSDLRAQAAAEAMKAALAAGIAVGNFAAASDLDQ